MLHWHFSASTLLALKRYLPQMLVAIAILSVTSAAYVSVVISTSSKLEIKWNLNPATIQLSSTSGQGSAVVQFACNQNTNHLVLTPKIETNKVRLTVSPQNISFCSSAPVAVTLTAVCKGYQTSCATEEKQEFEGQVDVTQPYNNYYGDQNIRDFLKVKIVIPPQGPDFELKSNSTSISCAAGQTVATTMSVTPLNGFLGTTKLSALVLPVGITVGVSPQNILGYGRPTLTINCSTAGTFNVEVRGVTNYETHGITITVTVSGNNLPSFTVAGEESTLECTQGGAVNNDITVSAKNGFTGNVVLSAEVTPSGLTATITPDVLQKSGSAKLTVHCTTAGMYSVKVKGLSGDISSTFTVPVTVTSPNTGDFTITADPTSLSKGADVTATSTIDVTSTGMFTGTVAISLSAQAGLSCQPVGSSLTVSTAGGDAATSLRCSGHTPGTYTATVTGTAAGKTHKVDVTFTVQGTSLAANNPNMFGVDPMIFYSIISVVTAAVVGSGLLLLRRGSR